MLRSSSSEYTGPKAAPPPPPPPAPSSQPVTNNNASSLPDQYAPPYAFRGAAGGGAAPPLLHTSPPPSNTSAHLQFQRQEQQQLLHSAPHTSLSRAGLPYATLSAEQEGALRAKGRQLLEEHRRESTGTNVYSPEEKAALQQRGMELLCAARDEAAANGGQHVPAPLLNAAARVAAATTAVRRHDEGHSANPHSGSGGVSGGGEEDVHVHAGSGAPQQLSASQAVAAAAAQAAPALVHSPQPPHKANVDDKLGGVEEGMGEGRVNAAAEARVVELLAEVERLQRLVAAQDAELSSARSAAAAATQSSSETFTKAQMESARQDLIQQFNQHMAQCEQANQDYWAQVSAEHRQEVEALRRECAVLTHGIETMQSTQKVETESNAEAAASLHEAVTVLKRELTLAQQECTEASLAREAAEREVTLLTERLRDQDDEITRLENALATAAAEAQRVAQENSEELQGLRDHLLQLQNAYNELEAANAELQAAKLKLESAQAAAPVPAVQKPHGAANPFADGDAEDPFGDPSQSVPSADADNGELEAARQRIADLAAVNADLETANAELQAMKAKFEAAEAAKVATAAPPAYGTSNLFSGADAADPFGASSNANEGAAAEDSALQAAHRRIADLESTIAGLKAANAKLETAQTALAPAAHDTANPFGDVDAEDPFGDVSRAAPVPAPAPVTADELEAAHRRIAELQSMNANLEAANAELQAAKLKLESAQAAAPVPAVQKPHGAANPFADAEAEDPFGDPSQSVPSANADNGELEAARQRIADLAAVNADLETANAELQAMKAKFEAAEAAKVATAAPPAYGTSNLFSGADAADPFGASSNANEGAAAEDSALQAAHRRIADLEFTIAGLKAANAKLETAQTALAPAAHDTANPFGDVDAEDPFGDVSRAAPVPAPAPVTADELEAAHRRIAELQSMNANLEAANAELQAAKLKLESAQAAAPVPAAQKPHGAANPFADAEAEDPFGDPSQSVPSADADNGELEAARQRIQQLEGENAELAGARERIADLENALHEASGNVEKMQEDLEDKEHLIQALRAGEAALGSMSADLMSRGSGWGAALPSEPTNAFGEDDASRSGDMLKGLRARVEELTHQLAEERQAHRRTEEDQQQQQHHPKTVSPSSQMVPGMEDLGRQYADVLHRLSLAEEARVALEGEVQRLRRGGHNGMTATSTSPATAEADVAAQAHTTGPSAALASIAAVNPFAETDESDDEDGEDGEVTGAAVTVRGGRSARTANSSRNDNDEDEDDEDDDGHNTPETQASFHMGHSTTVPLDANGGFASDSVFGVPEDVECQASAFAHEEAQSETQTTSAAARGEEAARRAPRESCDVLDDEETTDDADVSVSTRVTAARGRLAPAMAASKVEDSGLAMQELGRQYAEAQHRLLRSEEARQALEGEVAELRRALAQLQATHSSPSSSPNAALEGHAPPAHHHHPHHHHQKDMHPRHLGGTCEGHPGNELDNTEDLEEDLEEAEETRTVTTSFASSIPTAARERPTATPLDAAARAAPSPQRAEGEDDATMGPVATAVYSEREEDPLVAGDDGAAEIHMAEVGEAEPDGSDVAAINAALYRRIAELEAELQTMSTSHEEELQALADAAADRIAALEQEYAAAAATTVDGAAIAKDTLEEEQGEESDVFADAAAAEEQRKEGEGGMTASAPLSITAAAAPPVTLATVAAARAEREKDLEEECRVHEQRLRDCEREVEALKAEAEIRDAEHAALCNRDQASHEEIEALRAELSDARQARHDIETELRHAEEQWTRLSKTLDEVQAAHEEELAVLAAKCNREIANHDELLRLRLEEQEEAFEAAIQQLDQQHQDQLRLLAADASAEKEGEGAAAAAQTKESDTVRPATGAKEAAESEAAYWKAQHSTLQERFDQLQRDYDDFAQDTAALQRRLREHETAQQSQEQSRTTRDAAAQQLTTLHHRLAEMTRLVEAAQADAEARTTELREAAAVHAERESVLQAELTSVRAQAKSSREEVTRLSDLNEELSELLQQGATGVEAALQDRDAQLAVLETQVRDLKLQLAASGDRLTERQTLLQELRDDRDSLQQLVEELKATNRTLEVQLRESRRVSEEQARVAAHEADRAVRDAEQARVAAQHALAEQHKSHQLNISALEAQLDDLRREVEVAQTVAATVPLEAQKHQRDLETVRERLTEALRSQQELQQQLKNSRGEVVRQRRLLRGVNADGSEVDTSAMNTTADAGAEEDGAGGAPTSAADARVNALLRTIEELEEKLHEASAERDIFQQERDRVTMQLKSAARVAEVKEQAMRRQEAELRSMRSQLTTIRDDLAQRVQSNHALQLEMDHLHERVADVTSANAELQEQHIADVERRTLQEHAEALLFAKAMTIPRALEDHISGLCAGYHTLLQVSSKDREYVYGRCDTIEKAAGEAMAEAEAQNHAYEVALADAQEEQQQLKDIIERLEEVLKKAEETKATAVAEAKAAKEELETVQRQAREDVFNAQRDLQMAELQHADTLHSLSLLQDEVTNTAALIKNQKATYERREAELMEEVAQLQAELEARKASVRVLQQSSDENRNMLQDVADQAEQQRDAAVREAQALRAQLERALPRLAQLEDEQAQRTADLMDTAQQLSALHKKSSSTEEVSRKHIEELNQTLQELLHAHAALQRTHSTTEATADRLKTQLESATQELERATTKAHHQEEEATQLRTRLQEVETRTNRVITDDQARLRDAERRIQGLEQRNTALQQECKSLQESQQSLRMEFESTADALQRLTEKANAQEQQQAHQIRLLRERADTLETERQALLTAEQVVTKERDGCQREILQLQHKIEHLQHHLSDANGHNETLNQEMVELKTEHASEVDRLRDAITDAQKELTKCRQLLAEAETHQVEQDSTHYSLTTEINVLREELKSARAQAEKAMQQYQKEKTEREEMATLLQSQMAQLYEELRSKQEQLRIIENTAANQLDTINALRQDVAELEERLKHTRKELLDVQEAATAAKEHHRRDRYELQSKLNIAEDAAAELTRQHNQYRERMTTKVELYEVAEQALRGEVTDLRADVARLEGALTATTQGKEAAEDVKSRQAHSIKAAETEVQTLRAQTARDMSELTALKVQLQQRTTEVERIHREAAAQLAAEKLRWEADHVAACDALEEALRREQQATRDAREARERALTSLERKQRDVAAMEEECRAMRAQVRHLQRRIDVAEYHLTALQGMARDSAADLGVSLEELTGGAMAEEGGLIAAQDSQLDTSGVTGSDAATMTTTTTAATAGAAVQAVLDELVRRLNIYTFVANTLDTEDAQLTALSQALEQQQDAVDALVEAGTAGDGVATTPYNTSGVTPLRGGRLNSTLGLNNTPAARGAPQSTPSAAAGSAAAVLPRSLTSAQQVFVQQISQASSTYVHRVEDHLRTAQQMLRSVAMAVGAHEVATGGRPSSSSTAAGSTAVLNSRPSTVALSSHHKLQVAATAAELHRRTAALTRAVDRVVEAIVGGASPAFRPPPLPSQASGGSYVGDAPSSPASPTAVVNLQAALLELRRMFAEAECFALLPFNELLCTGDTTTTTAAAAAAALSGLPGATASESEQMYGRRGRQGGRLQTPPRTQQQQAASSSTVLGAERHLTSATSDSVARRAPVPGAEAAVGSASRGGTASATQLAPPVVPSLALSSQLSTRRRADGAAPSRPRGDDSGVVSTLSPIPADDEANWF